MNGRIMREISGELTDLCSRVLVFELFGFLVDPSVF